MGKPKGEGGRSKGRPSSSSLAASLLSPGVSNVGFGGYLGSSRVETSSLGEEAGSSSSDVDGELAQHLKRLGRKDPITKVKALTTLGALFKHISGSDLALIIPKWAFEYRKLLYDYNRDVRRCTHEAMASLVASVRRGLVPHLKSLMGPWWFSQFDPVPEVAQAARRSLEAAFPAQEKRLDALVLCANEIFLYLEDNLRLKPQEMIEKSLPPDELEEMHNHVISSSLLAVATLLDVLIGTKLQNDGSDMATEGSKGTVKACQSIKSSAERIFSGHNWFLGFFKSKSPRVRSATYSILGTYIKHMPHAFNSNNIKSLSAAILSIFGEKDPSCHSSMWDMVLLFSKKFPDCWFYTSVQKSSFPRIWSFLRNGCYGSQQVSYPILILFLDSMPLNSIFGESFLLKFLQCLWAGRNPHASALDQTTFFNAFKECFLWGLFNASRYFSGEEDIFDFQGNLIMNILVVLLWHGYLLPVQNDQEELLTEKSKSVILDEPQILNARFLQGYSVNYPAAYFQELARCIILILSNISLRKSSLLQTFCTSFQKDCLYILQQEEDRQRYSELSGRINIFLLLLDELALQRNETWPLNHMAGPLFAKLFPLLRPLDSPDAVKILHTLVEIFGARTIVSQIFNSSDHYRSALSDENVDKLMMNFFLDIFKKDFIPLCMKSYSLSGSSRLDLLISLLDEEIFSEQWSFIIVYAEKLQKDAQSDYIRVLAMLMDKIRENIGNKTLGIKLQTISGDSEFWPHDFLNSMAVSIACQRTPFNRYEASFLCAALGGSSEFDQTCFLSGETVFIVFEEILWKLIGFLRISPFTWARSSIDSWDSVNKVELPPADALEMVQFAFEVINGSIYRLKKLDDEEYGLVASIFAIIFIIGWEDNVRAVAFVDDELTEDNSDDVYLGKKILDFRSRVSSSFLRSLSLRCRAKMEDILVMAIRAAISDADTLSVENITTFCCRWVVEMLEDICLDGFEEQEVLTKLLSCGESWAVWVSPCSFDGRSSIIPSEIPNRTHDFAYQSFSSFVNKLVLNLGVGKIIAGHVSVPDEQFSSLSLARPWLAAELLCSWKWHGICASESFLQLLNDFAKTESSAKESIISFVAKLLIDGAIVHANTGQPIILNAWILSDDEVETIQNTYLRALIALLLTLTVKDNTWAEEEAYLLLDYTLAKLYLGAEVDLNCLKILPFILNVVIQSLRSGEPVSDRFHRYVSAWLEKALSLPPLALTQATYNNSVEWMQIVISCYPLCILKENKNIQVTAFQDISHLERESLLSLFRRQRYSLGDNSEVKAQTMLANVTAVSIGYCWKEFDDIDWDYVFSQMQLWTNSTVLMMEEATESVDAIIRNARPNSKLDTILRNIEKTMEIIIPSPINITRVALVIFSLVCQHADSTAFQSTRPTIWESIKDGIFEHALRLFFSTGVTEAIAGSFGVETSSIIASSRLICSQFWELVSFCVINSPNHVRVLGLQSMELWGLSKGPVEALYAILFSSKSLSSLQLAAFHILSSVPVSHSSVMKESCLIDDNQGETVLQSSFDESTCLRDEISCIIRNPANIVLKMDLTSPPRVNIFISWALLLSYLQSLPPSSSLREKLVQCIQDSISPIILDLIFQQFPLKGGSLHGQKKKDVEVPAETTKAANGAKHAITSCSLLFAVETFWPVSVESTAVIAGSVYGLMIHLLPAYVRNWFTALRDRTLSQSIESFTKVWCSPPLFSEELSQIKGAAFGDDNFSVSVNKSSLEIIATYKKEESGMDLVIRLPGCYPLKPVDVDCTRSLGVSEVKQRKWLLSLTAFVCNQNGAIAEAISTWKSNLEREFEGVEECPICYSIIHTTNHSLPRLACKTCKHKFHSACLYRWFSTSHKSTCPLCQTPF